MHLAWQAGNSGVPTMLSSSKRRPRALAMRGFTLVELMIALAVSLVVALAAVAFVVALMKANSENLKVTRLTQELRSLTEVMGREVRRARYVADPVGLIGSSGANNRDLIDTTTAGCIIFRYDEPPNPAGSGTTVSRSIRRDGTKIALNPVGTTCTGGSPISTDEVRITALNFTRTDSRVDISVTGELSNSPPDLAGVSRTFRQTVYVRSGEVN